MYTVKFIVKMNQKDVHKDWNNLDGGNEMSNNLSSLSNDHRALLLTPQLSQGSCSVDWQQTGFTGLLPASACVKVKQGVACTLSQLPLINKSKKTMKMVMI